ncbi:uncharacterized protein BJX67DRAFT_355092 [Aspergillus lucknowensis]|uniref:Uncharacterized protein n=1 Tax=Aspergillus lucknowensis TaxID=176173 RepID=A0ABR4LPU7_9EURO
MTNIAHIQLTLLLYVGSAAQVAFSGASGGSSRRARTGEPSVGVSSASTKAVVSAFLYMA